MEIISSKDFTERRWSFVSAIVLKQWRGPRPFNLPCFWTKSRTCSKELAADTLSVLYSMLPAKFMIFSAVAQAINGEIKQLPAAADANLRNVLLFIAAMLPQIAVFF